MGKETKNKAVVKEKSYLRLDEQVCFALYSTSLALNKVYRQHLKALNLTYPQYLVMLVLWEQDGLSVSEIGARLYLNSATLTPLLKRLEGVNLLARKRSDEDERQVLIHLTKEGRNLRFRAEAVPHSLLCSMDCSPQELARLRDQLVGLRKNLMDSKDYPQE